MITTIKQFFADKSLRELYHGSSTRSLRFRLGLLAFDLTTLLFFIVSSLFEPNYFIYAMDYLIALVIGADFAARVSLENDRKKSGAAWIPGSISR